MDLNYLYQRQQVSQFMAEHARSEAARRVHGQLASAYASRIAAAKNEQQIPAVA